MSTGKLVLPKMQITAESGKDERHMAMLTREPRQPVVDAQMQVTRGPAKHGAGGYHVAKPTQAGRTPRREHDVPPWSNWGDVIER
ncbi:hypothetical protein MY11210_005027 [Beauveria gryllotalpidicola]